MAFNVNAFEAAFAAMEVLAQRGLKVGKEATVVSGNLPDEQFDRLPANYRLRLSANRKKRMWEVTCLDYRVQGDLQHLLAAWPGAKLNGNTLTRTIRW